MFNGDVRDDKATPVMMGIDVFRFDTMSIAHGMADMIMARAARVL